MLKSQVKAETRFSFAQLLLFMKSNMTMNKLLHNKKKTFKHHEKHSASFSSNGWTWTVF